MPRNEWPYDPGFFDKLPLDPNRFGDHYDQIVDAIESLPEKQRQVIEMLFWGRMSEEAIGTELNVTQQTVNYHKKLAFESLREVLAKCV